MNKGSSYINTTSNINNTTKQNTIYPSSELTNENSKLWELQQDEELRIEVPPKEKITIIVKNFIFK